jgi:hypothetical protein
MKTTIKSQDELDELPDSDQGNDIKKMLSAPISVGDSQYMVEELTYDDGINKHGEAVDFPTMKISAVFLAGSLKANDQGQARR